MGIFHRLVFKHYVLDKDGIGILAFCVRRGPRGTVHGVAFKPDLPDSQPHRVPSPEALVELLQSSSALEAMAILRAHGGA